MPAGLPRQSPDRGPGVRLPDAPWDRVPGVLHGVVCGKWDSSGGAVAAVHEQGPSVTSPRKATGTSCSVSSAPLWRRASACSAEEGYTTRSVGVWEGGPGGE